MGMEFKLLLSKECNKGDIEMALDEAVGRFGQKKGCCTVYVYLRQARGPKRSAPRKKCGKFFFVLDRQKVR